MDTPINHINLFNAILALYVIGYQISICLDWSWIPMNKEDYQLPYQDKWSKVSQEIFNLIFIIMSKNITAFITC